jgi:cytochrome c553
MKRLMAITVVASCLLSAVYSWAATPSSNPWFKYHMHQIFDGYNNAKISFSLKQFDITNIYLQDLLESIDSAKRHVPDKNRDGTKLDKELFTKRIDKLKESVSSFKFINEVNFRDPLLTETLSKDMFNMCVTCHKEVKMDYLFKLPKQRTLFGEYMHKVSDNLDFALIKSEDESLSDETKEHVQLVNYYIDLLAPIFPEYGASGVIMDKERFQRRIMEIKTSLKNEGKSIKTANIERSRTTLNSLCVACHEPERIK